MSGKRHVGLREITLRQLGHMACDLTFEEKLYWLKCLADIGIKESVVWGIDEDAEDLVRGARAAGIDIAISFFGKVYFVEEMRRIFDRAAACGAAHVALVGRSAPFALEEMGWSEQQMLEACVSAVREAKQRGLGVSLGLAYATQARPGYVAEIGVALEAEKLDILHISDSLGVASPELMRSLVGEVRSRVSTAIEVHCHNDYGLATANAIASVQAGADIVEVVVNGQDPERSGIATLDEVAVALEYLYDIDTGIKLDRLTELSRLHERMTNMRIAANKPIVGRRAFNYRVASGAAASQATRDHFYGSPRVVPFDPATVGNKREFVVGKFSGLNEVAKRLVELQIELDEPALERVVALVQARGRGAGRAVDDDELRYFAQVAAPAGGQVGATA